MSFKEQMIDDLEEAYVDWRVQARRVQLAYETWSDAPSTDARLRYAAYLEELDRESRACDRYAAQVAVISAVA